MTPFNTDVEKVFNFLIDGLKEPGDHRKIDNVEGIFMPVSIDFVWWNDQGKIFAVAHHYIQNTFGVKRTTLYDALKRKG